MANRKEPLSCGNHINCNPTGVISGGKWHCIDLNIPMHGTNSFTSSPSKQNETIFIKKKNGILWRISSKSLHTRLID